jgi:hypothetical protein
MCCLDAGPIETTPRTRTKASLGGKVASSPARTRQRNRSAARAPLTAARRSGRDRMAQAGSGGNTHRHRLHREFGELDKHNCPARSDLVPPRACGFPLALARGPAVSPLTGALPLALAGFPSRSREGPRFPLSTALFPSRLQVSPRARARAPTVPPSRPSCFLLAAFARFPSVWQVFLFFIGSPLALARGPQPCRRCRRGFPSQQRSSPRARARATRRFGRTERTFTSSAPPSPAPPSPRRRASPPRAQERAAAASARPATPWQTAPSLPSAPCRSGR